eukprot:CAMPEP_0172480652 /NCGR_PEP_ID=MMETSP1066-20121228/5979_1 /TAXON_ID=671091 /ORGANISM="Coscinodiscus wailesii, Strain CCMP2513" /LENGTH=79 /DNA_ID=CAMNT_0013242183 /DNA_START=77 /DNA_END=316 /DNA_ORIENTATION=+
MVFFFGSEFVPLLVPMPAVAYYMANEAIKQSQQEAGRALKTKEYNASRLPKTRRHMHMIAASDFDEAKTKNTVVEMNEI